MSLQFSVIAIGPKWGGNNQSILDHYAGQKSEKTEWSIGLSCAILVRIKDQSECGRDFSFAEDIVLKELQG